MYCGSLVDLRIVKLFVDDTAKSFRKFFAPGPWENRVEGTL